MTIANTGDRPLQNVSLVMVGVPPSWYRIRPSGNVDIDPDRKKTFSVRFNVPEGANIQTYNGTFLTTSTRDSDRSAVEVNIFASLKQKIQADIERLQQALQELKDQMEALQEQGADVSELQSLITQIELNLRNARKNLNQSQYQQALNQISNAESLISRSNNIISKIDTQQRQFERFFQYLPLVGIILGLVAAIIIGIYLLRVVRIQPLAPVRERFHDAMVQMKKHRKQKEEELRDEKRKTERLLELLEAQHKEGIMSDETYQDLKTSAEQKLDRINDKLRKRD
ncbi:MAG: hypothetical protein SVU32_05680 [Candidatus Nanohaloarchaea archaeon]|nr:hypothetical protein [Candidatus Nanohaloarchaea archaeon]